MTDHNFKEGDRVSYKIPNENCFDNGWKEGVFVRATKARFIVKGLVYGWERVVMQKNVKPLDA